ncbi:hypothetical protein PQX77_016695 [Marasmius sp. AFHP31]|nr:hypothetical protein PQX77_016695 [Marasmius sp. AFHP31]
MSTNFNINNDDNTRSRRTDTDRPSFGNPQIVNYKCQSVNIQGFDYARATVSTVTGAPPERLAADGRTSQPNQADASDSRAHEEIESQLPVLSARSKDQALNREALRAIIAWLKMRVERQTVLAQWAVPATIDVSHDSSPALAETETVVGSDAPADGSIHNSKSSALELYPK